MAILTQAPARRLAYHLDGSQVSWWLSTGSTTILDQTQLNNLNDFEFTSDNFKVVCSLNAITHILNINVLFGNKINLQRYFIFLTKNATGGTINFNEIFISTDTTNGQDGIWTSLTIPNPNGLNIMNTPTYGLNMLEWFNDTYISGNLTGAIGIKGIRFGIAISTTNGVVVDVYLNTLNLWGNINDTTSTQRVAWVDNVGNPLAIDKLYSIKRGNADIISGQYLKNLHSTSTTKIVFSIDGEITSVNNNTTISVDGGITWNILPYTWNTSLASNTVSSEIKIKYTVPISETLGLKYYGINANPTFV